MEDAHLYQQIVAEVRKEITAGRLKPGDRLPSVRQMTGQWHCTVGTVQRAYQELARQGLVISRAGQGTHVLKAPQTGSDTPLRRASMVHRAEAFLLEMLTAGYTLEEIDAAIGQAKERWQIITRQPQAPEENTLRFAGSHDPMLAWLATHFPQIVPKFHLALGFTGSLGGLIALAEGKADLAGCHLWDEQTHSYNEPFVRRLLPGKRVALVTLAHRRLGLMRLSDNPYSVESLADLAQPGLTFANRQSGSGTRVWLDAALARQGIATRNIKGYTQEFNTHFEVAAAVAEGRADTGFGLETAARAYGLAFTYLVRERYDLVIPGDNMFLPSVHRLVDWLGSPAAHQAIASLTGYDLEETGMVRWVEA